MLPVPTPRPLGAPAALLLLATPIAAAMAGPPSVQAGSRTLQVAPLISRTPSGPCPTTLRLQETHQP